MLYILGTISSIICILLGFWLGKGCPIPKRTIQANNTIENELSEAEKQQQEYERQFQNLMNHSGEL